MQAAVPVAEHHPSLEQSRERAGRARAGGDALGLRLIVATAAPELDGGRPRPLHRASRPHAPPSSRGRGPRSVLVPRPGPRRRHRTGPHPGRSPVRRRAAAGRAAHVPPRRHGLGKSRVTSSQAPDTRPSQARRRRRSAGMVYAENPGFVLASAEKAWSARLASPAMRAVVCIDRELCRSHFLEDAGLDLVDRSTLVYHVLRCSGLAMDYGDRMNRAVLGALKPGGKYVVIDHSARARGLALSLHPGSSPSSGM